MKKILAVLLTFVMAFTFMMPAFAADEANTDASVTESFAGVFDSAEDVYSDFKNEDYKGAATSAVTFAENLFEAIHGLVHALSVAFDFDCPFDTEKTENTPSEPSEPSEPEVPEEPSEPVEIVPDEDWYTAEEPAGGYVITTAEEFAAFAQAVNNGDCFTGKKVVLGADIDLSGKIWAPIGTYDYAFEGIFDGMDYTISNLYINAPEADAVALFGVAQNATFKDININNVDITGYEMVAAIVAYPYIGCTISDCNISGDISLVAVNTHVGGIASLSYANIDNCSVIANGTGKITAMEKNAAAGIVAWSCAGNYAITDCKVKNLEITAWTNVGGIAGCVNGLNTIDGCVVDNVTLTKTRTGGHPAIGLAAGGYNYSASKAITITNNVFKNITLTNTSVIVDSSNVMYGSEYSGKTLSNFVMENNTVKNISFLYN